MKSIREPAGLKKIAKRLEEQLKQVDSGVIKVDTAYALQSRMDTPDKARWTLFVYAMDPESVKLDPEFEGYPVQVRNGTYLG